MGWLFPFWKQPLSRLIHPPQIFFQVFADSRNLHSKQFSHRLLCNPQAFIHNQSSPSLMLEKSTPSDSRPVVLAPCPSGNAGDHHSILSISIFTCHLFPSLSICRLKTGEALARGSAHPKFNAPPTSGASLPVYTKSLNRSVLYTPFSSIFLKLSFTAATSS